MTATCVLCGVDLDLHPAKRTSEHVMGKWLSRRADNPKLMINGMKRFYGSVRIPACSNCNSGPMAEIEAAVASALDSGDKSVAATLDGRVWGAWAAKVSFGLLAAEFEAMNLNIETSLVLPPMLAKVQGLALQHRALYRAYMTGSVGDPEMSVVAFATQHDRAKKDITTFLCDEQAGTLIVGVEGVAVFVSLFEGGYCSSLANEYVQAALSLKLNPIQVTEIYCRFVDALNSRVEVRQVHTERDQLGYRLVARGRNLMGPPVEGFLAGLLRTKLAVLGFEPEHVLDPPQTWLLDERGVPRHLPIDDTRGRSAQPEPTWRSTPPS